MMTPSEMRYRERRCIPGHCKHPTALTWLCIEVYLAMKPGTTHLASLLSRLKETDSPTLVDHGHPDGEEFLARLDHRLRAYIQQVGPQLLNAQGGGP